VGWKGDEIRPGTPCLLLETAVLSLFCLLALRVLTPPETTAPAAVAGRLRPLFRRDEDQHTPLRIDRRERPHVFAWRGRSRERRSEGSSEAREVPTRRVCMHSRTRTLAGTLECLALRIVYLKAVIKEQLHLFGHENTLGRTWWVYQKWHPPNTAQPSLAVLQMNSEGYRSIPIGEYREAKNDTKPAPEKTREHRLYRARGGASAHPATRETSPPPRTTPALEETARGAVPAKNRAAPHRTYSSKSQATKISLTERNLYLRLCCVWEQAFGRRPSS